MKPLYRSEYITNNSDLHLQATLLSLQATMYGKDTGCILEMQIVFPEFVETVSYESKPGDIVRPQLLLTTVELAMTREHMMEAFYSDEFDEDLADCPYNALFLG